MKTNNIMLFLVHMSILQKQDINNDTRQVLRMIYICKCTVVIIIIDMYALMSLNMNHLNYTLFI